jgi:cytochrome d ubiquinol oxidase subunit I
VVSGPELVFSIVLFGVVYLVLGALWLFLLRREVLHGPADGSEGEVRHAAA